MHQSNKQLSNLCVIMWICKIFNNILDKQISCPELLSNVSFLYLVLLERTDTLDPALFHFSPLVLFEIGILHYSSAPHAQNNNIVNSYRNICIANHLLTCDTQWFPPTSRVWLPSLNPTSIHRRRHSCNIALVIP